MLKPLSSLIALFVVAAHAADMGGFSRATTPVRTSSGMENVSSRATERGVAKGDRTTDAERVGVVSRNATNARSASSTQVRQSDAARGVSTAKRVGVTARSNFSETGRRITVRNTEDRSETDAEKRGTTERVASKTVTKESIAEAKGILEQTAELNKSCQDQYNECMDQFCAVVDANQKRCSCSANLSKYTKVEEAVNSANNKLNEVAQNIRYIGLSADEIRAIMTATEAEEALAGTKDNTENRNMLEQIERMIKDPKTSSASYSGDSFGIDMDLNFSSDASDIFNLDFLNTTSTTSFSNLRGSELYNAARSRCNTVLNQCKKAGATVTQVTGNYDLSIDKDCVAYETGLKKMNETLVSNVHSAELMLQKARLAVLQNKNQYDAKGCISALEACMTDDMVCGDDYAKCVDPTKIYIDENGNVVLGKNIANITKFMTNYSNTNIDKSFLESAYGMTISDANCAPSSDSDTTNGAGQCTVNYLLQKIGTKQKVTDEGLCRAVLDKCQAYTYVGEEYQPYNAIVVNYIQRAMVNIKAAQYKIISDYASSCMVDIASCYNQQVTQVNAWSSSASVNSVYNVMNGACRNVALTCGLAIFAGDPEISPEYNLNIDGQTYHVYGCDALDSLGGSASVAQKNTAIINCVSEIFYQSLLCPDNSIYVGNGNNNGADVNAVCKCNDGYEALNGSCLVKCQDGVARNSNGVCENNYFEITLNKNGGGNGSNKLYVSNSKVYLDSSHTSELGTGTTCANKITIPTKSGNTFNGYYSAASNGTQYINRAGCATSAGVGHYYQQNETWYAQWSAIAGS